MSNFEAYKFGCIPTNSELKKILRDPRISHQLGKSDVARMCHPTADLFGRFYDNARHDGVSPITISVYMERLWFEGGCTHVFVNDLSMLNMLLNAKLSVTPEDVLKPQEVYAIAVPRELGMIGWDIRPSLIGRVEDTNSGSRAVSVCRLGFAGWSAFYKPISKPIDDTDGMRDFDSLDNEQHCISGLSVEEKLTYKKIFRLGIALSAYIRAFPEYIHDGPPKEMRKAHARAFCGENIKTVRLSDDIYKSHPKGTPIAHWRSGHFRTLRDGRFRRNPDGTPRVVYVNHAMVSAQHTQTAIKPETFRVSGFVQDPAHE